MTGKNTSPCVDRKPRTVRAIKLVRPYTAVRYKMDLQKFPDSVLVAITDRIRPWHWDQWYALIRVCKRFKLLLYGHRQIMLQMYIKWVEPNASTHCDRCPGSLTDHCMVVHTQPEPDDLPGSESESNSELESWETYCSPECAALECVVHPCDCGSGLGFTIEDRQFKCLKCDPNSLNRHMPARRHIPPSSSSKQRVMDMLDDGILTASPNCFMCGRPNFTRSIVVTDIYETTHHGKVKFPHTRMDTGIVCGYMCLCRYEAKGEIETFKMFHNLYRMPIDRNEEKVEGEVDDSGNETEM